MKTPKTYSSIPKGFDAELVTVEGDISRGLTSFNIVGLANKTIEESRERIRAAIRNSKLHFPSDRLTINLAPAGLQKSGSYLDLAIAVNILALTGQLLASDIAESMFVGELALDGRLRPVRGIINVAECAEKRGFKNLYLPTQNAAQVHFLRPKNLRIIPVSSLGELVLTLKGIIQPSPRKQPSENNVVKNTYTDSAYALLDQIIGQEQAKRALIVALAGRHNLLLFGPPGSGKSMLAACAPRLLPPLTHQEAVEATKLHSLTENLTTILSERPFRAPHHSASRSALVGSGFDSPGEISLAHTGVLYLDELPEFHRDFLEALRQPLESHTISITRAKQRVSFPANFVLIATMNPCPCGYYGDDHHQCKCNPTQRANYIRRLSGPLLDRIDMTVRMPHVDSSVLVKNTTISTREDASAKRQIEAATKRQRARQGKQNGLLSSYETTRYCPLSKEAEHILSEATRIKGLSARSYFKLIKVARTIADLAKSDQIEADHILEALQFRDIGPNLE